MATLVFYVEVTTYDENNRLVDVHNSTSGGLPILYWSEKKAKSRAAKIRQSYLDFGWSLANDNAFPPYRLLALSGLFTVDICIREVRVQV